MLLQKGRALGNPQSKPMKSIHKNAFELRIKGVDAQYRVIYVLAIKDQVIIPHAFIKKTQKTPKKEIDLSIKRLKGIFNEAK
jgi:phage-related protein